MRFLVNIKPRLATRPFTEWNEVRDVIDTRSLTYEAQRHWRMTFTAQLHIVDIYFSDSREVRCNVLMHFWLMTVKLILQHDPSSTDRKRQRRQAAARFQCYELFHRARSWDCLITQKTLSLLIITCLRLSFSFFFARSRVRWQEVAFLAMNSTPHILSDESFVDPKARAAAPI